MAINFLLIHSAPGDPVYAIAGEYHLTPELMETVRHEWGLDQPLHIQLFIYMGNIIRGDLGYSFFYGQPVTTVIMEKIPATLLLMVTSLIFASVVGIILGVISSRKPYSVTDNLVMLTSLVGYSLPIFLTGLMLLLLFSLQLGWLPAQGISSVRVELTGIDYVVDVASHLILPALSLGIHNLALITRLMRANMLEVLGLDYITMARSKGLKEGTVVYKHALRNALSPVVTVIGLYVGAMFAGALMTETVFGWPGIGTLAYKGIGVRDYPLLMGIFLVVSVMAITANLVTDVVYALIDPRIRYR
jgi:peptide/nickel transport system permease protein